MTSVFFPGHSKTAAVSSVSVSKSISDRAGTIHRYIDESRSGGPRYRIDTLSRNVSILNVHFRPVITRWSGYTSRVRVIGEARYANLLSRTRLIAVSVVFWWVGNLYDVFIGVVVYRGVLVKWNKQK